MQGIAINLFKKLLGFPLVSVWRFEKLPEDGPAKTLLGRLEMFKKQSPAAWDGVWRFESK